MASMFGVDRSQQPT